MSLHFVEALNDRDLFQPFFVGDSWNNWKVLLKTLPLPEPLPLNADELEVFKQFTGRSKQPERVRECYPIVGRGSGKTRISATIATFIACFRDLSRYLAAGQVATIPLLAADRKQAHELMNYCRGLVDSIPVLKRMVVNETKESIELSTRCLIEVRVCSIKSIRGVTSPCACADELAFWWNDLTYTNPSTEIIKSLRPSLGRVPDSLLLGLSSPYSRKGHLFEMHDRHYGKDDSSVLVWNADTLSMNPLFDRSVIDQAFMEDEASAMAEYGRDGHVEFRRDVESYVSREIVMQCVIAGRYENPFDSQFNYQGFCDPSGGSNDSFTLAIAHHEHESEKAILDLVREVRPPFSPSEVVKDYSEILKQYGINRVCGDRYSGEFVKELFRKNEIEYQPSEKTKSEIYKDFLGILNSGKCELLENQRLINQLCGLETRSGKTDHAPNSHDDLINSGAGAIVGAHKVEVNRCNEFLLFGSCSNPEHPQHHGNLHESGELPRGMF